MSKVNWIVYRRNSKVFRSTELIMYILISRVQFMAVRKESEWHSQVYLLVRHT